MKNFLRSLPLLLGLAVSTAHAQKLLPEDRIAVKQAIPANQFWHWFAPTSEAMDWVLSRPGWKLYGTEEKGADKMASFFTADRRFSITLHLFHDHLGGITYGFPADAPASADWLTQDKEQEREGRWIDRPHNATITRRYMDEWIIYRVNYAPYSN